MNCKMLKKGILGFCTMSLMVGSLLLLSCGSDDEISEDGGSWLKPYLALNQYGVNKLAIASDGSEVIYTLAVKKRGGKAQAELAADLNVWTEDELKDFNKKEKSSYLLLPEDCYTISSSHLVFSPEAKEVSVDIKVKSSKIVATIEQGKNYVIALRLSSDGVDLRKGQCDILLHVATDYATLGFASADVVGRINVKNVNTYAGIKTILNYKVDGKDKGSGWDFSCELKVPENAEELVASYNEKYNSNVNCCLPIVIP